ncbi:MAG: hypothetical protein HZB53_12850 [Chloroflexi bacterium]|nr:hypothetical protein [Chloroflexota bacterium]
MRELRLLAASAAATAVVYALYLPVQFPLAGLYLTPQLDLGSVSDRQPAAAALFAAGSAAVFGLYALALVAARRIECASGVISRQVWVLTLSAGMVFALIMVWTYPVGAVDVYDYIFRGRMWMAHGLNPLVVAPEQAPGDPWLPFVAWSTYPSPYGPLWATISAFLCTLAGSDLLVNLLVFKLAAIASLSVVSLLTASLLKGSGRALSGVLFLAWNPLVLFEAAVNGHNDIFMLLFAALSLWLFQRRRHPAAWACAALAAQIKIVAVALSPALALAVIIEASRVHRNWRSAVRSLIVGALAWLIVFAGAYAPWWAGDATLDGIWLLQDRFTSSAATVLKLGLEALDYPANAGESARLAALAAALAVMGYASLLAWRRRSALPEITLGVFWPVVALGTLWFQPWYVMWLVAWAALGGPAQRRTAALCAAGALSLYVLFDFAWFWYPAWLNAANTLAVNAVAVALWLAAPLTVSWLYARRRRASLPQSGT